MSQPGTTSICFRFYTWRAGAILLSALLFLAACAAPNETPNLAPEAACVPGNIAQGRASVSSPTENGGFKAFNAFDGSMQTRWASDQSDDKAWLQVNLGRNQTLCQMVLHWEAAYAQAFEVQVSDDAQSWETVYEETDSEGGVQTLDITATGRYVRLELTGRASSYGYSLFEVKIFGTGEMPDMPGMPLGEYIPAPNPVTDVEPSIANPPHRLLSRVSGQLLGEPQHFYRTTPIVFFGKPGESHMHTFMGNTTTDANTTLESLQAGDTSCLAVGDKSAYWMPTMYNGDEPVLPVGPQVIYYKTGVHDYTSVRPFPPGLRFIVGDMNATPAEFAAGSFEGWECGESYQNSDFPDSCPANSQLNVRYQAPSCWDGLHLDSPNHKSHMAYPVNGRCTESHPVAVPMIEFKMAFPVSGDTSQVRLASGAGYSFHYDFYNAWDPPQP